MGILVYNNHIAENKGWDRGMGKSFGGVIVNWLFSRSEQKVTLDKEVSTLRMTKEKSLNEIFVIERKNRSTTNRRSKN